MARRTLCALSLLLLAFVGASVARAEGTTQVEASRSAACMNRPYSYAGLQSETKAHGVAATLVPVASPSVLDGHVGGWIGVGGPSSGPGGVPQWLQVGLAAFTSDKAARLYYEVTVAGKSPRYVELAESVRPGSKYRLAVREVPRRSSWWRVWVNGRPASPAIRLPGSHGKWYPQAMSENFNGGSGMCNGFTFRFTDVEVKIDAKVGKKLRQRWQPLRAGFVWQDAGYKLLRTASRPGSFVATSV